MFATFDFTPTIWIVAALSSLMIGVAKGGLAGGVGVIATPLMALVLPVAEATAILLPLLLLADFSTAPYYFRKGLYDRTSLLYLIPSGLIGVVMGGLTFQAFIDQERLLKIGLALMSFAFLAYQFFVLPWLQRGAQPTDADKKIDKKDESARPWAAGWLAGVTGGFTSTIAHVGGPPVTIYMIPLGLDRRRFIGTFVMTFAVINVAKLVPYYLLGTLTAANFSLLLVLGPVALAGVGLGIWINRNLNDRIFLYIIYGFVFLTGIQLLWGESLLSRLF